MGYNLLKNGVYWGYNPLTNLKETLGNSGPPCGYFPPSLQIPNGKVPVDGHSPGTTGSYGRLNVPSFTTIFCDFNGFQPISDRIKQYYQSLIQTCMQGTILIFCQKCRGLTRHEVAILIHVLQVETKRPLG